MMYEGVSHIKLIKYVLANQIKNYCLPHTSRGQAGSKNQVGNIGQTIKGKVLEGDYLNYLTVERNDLRSMKCLYNRKASRALTPSRELYIYKKYYSPPHAQMCGGFVVTSTQNH